ncbi:response regulator [Pseudonocardia oroxyli]|uniref:Two component transcriptional regulator, LuxR family n=1 Tax=Pseudonocardia oroxyli TaxID=366584 RepID=A0A1G8BEM0_PSEOR|nr:response regulator transcription factor [Pseudonocardia oroxyli]SDH31608.1 two component transcriptional regulator, LuxR family [Pseudonocardia oroxyli]
MDRVDLDGRATVAVIDDHAIARRGLRSLLGSATPGLDVIADGATVDIALGTGPGADADVVVLDLQLVPGRPTLDGLQRLIDAGKRVVVYTQFVDDALAVRCVDVGALAYVTKPEVEEHLIEAVRAAAAGNPYTPPNLGGALAGDTDPTRPELSVQEITALRVWFTSRSKGMAAEAMGVAPATIHTYIDRARMKYAARGRPARSKAEMVKRALEDGLVTLADLEPPERHR